MVSPAADAGGMATAAVNDSLQTLDLPMTRFVNTPPQHDIPAPQGIDVGMALSGLFDRMRFNVIRIQALVQKIDWLQPYQQPTDVPFIGSGFPVATEEEATGKRLDPVFLTNAHVVQDAALVQVQLPAIGQQTFEGYVPLICKKFDIAIVKLKRPSEFSEALNVKNGTMQALRIYDRAASLGLEVAAVGFPLGSSSLKLSRGIISGTEVLAETTSYQSTAPISPGSSGGPLFALDPGTHNLQVVGMNYASSASKGAQNVNYAVPTIHILQVLREFDRMRGSKAEATATSSSLLRRSSAPQTHVRVEMRGAKKQDRSSNGTNASVRQEAQHVQLRVAPIDAIGIEANEALYNASGGCTKGVFLSRILPTSLLRLAVPPVPERSFLTSVNSVSLDAFGMGRTEYFLGDPLPFEGLMMLRPRLDDPVPLTVCLRGRETTHNASLLWRPEYSMEVEDVDEPHFQPDKVDFEVFAGVTFMQMTVNHIMDLLRLGRPQTLSRWLLVENQMQPRLLITHVEEGGYTSRVLAPGMVVQKVNGANVSSLHDLRRHFQPRGATWAIETDRGLVCTVNFHEAFTQQLAVATTSHQRRYLLTPAVQVAARLMHSAIDVSNPKAAASRIGSDFMILNTGGINADVTFLPRKPANARPRDAIATAATAEGVPNEVRAKAQNTTTMGHQGERALRKSFLVAHADVAPLPRLFVDLPAA